MLVGAAALTVGALISSAEQARNFTPVEKAACGPHWGRFCGPVSSPGLRPLALLVRPVLNA